MGRAGGRPGEPCPGALEYHAPGAFSSGAGGFSDYDVAGRFSEAAKPRSRAHAARAAARAFSWPEGWGIPQILSRSVPNGFRFLVLPSHAGSPRSDWGRASGGGVRAVRNQDTTPGGSPQELSADPRSPLSAPSVDPAYPLPAFAYLPAVPGVEVEVPGPSVSRNRAVAGVDVGRGPAPSPGRFQGLSVGRDSSRPRPPTGAGRGPTGNGPGSRGISCSEALCSRLPWAGL